MASIRRSVARRKLPDLASLATGVAPAHEKNRAYS
jgi:hypothetical protein